MTKHNWIYRVALVIGLAMMATVLATAQSGTSAIHGTVVDPQNSVIPNATVVLTNSGNNSVRTATTGPTGSFSFDLVSPGNYRLEVHATGFQNVILNSVQALVDRPTELHLKMSLGVASQTVTVEASAAEVQVNTEDSSLGNDFVNKQITQLPLEARNVVDLLSLQPGVTRDGYVSGARSDQSNVTLDGVNINDAQTNSIGSPVLRLNDDAIEEFRVNTVTSSSAAARSSGAQISLVTRSGTNSWHADAYDYNRNTVFTANDWFNNKNGLPRPALIRNTFGGSVGGPIIHNKFFFFVSYEGRRDRSQAAVSAVTVPLPSLAQGIVKFIDSNGAQEQLTSAELAQIFPDLGGMNPDSLTGLAQGAAYTANSNSVGDGLNTSGFVFNAPTPVNENSTTVKLDYNLRPSQSLSIRANYIDDHSVSAPRLPGQTAPTAWSHPEGIAVRYTWTHGNLVSNFTYGDTREAITSGGDTNADATYFRLVYQPLALSYDNSRVTPVQNFVEDLSLVHGRHTLQFGGEVTLVNNGVIQFNKAYSTATTNPSGYKTNLISNAINQYLTENRGYTESSGSRSNVENAVTALIGRYNNYSANFLYNVDGSILAAGAPAVRHFATQGYEGYIQDNWKVKQNLNLTFGLRYNLWRPPYETNGFEVQPTIPLGQIFQNRVNSMNSGTNDTTPVILNKSGPVNGGKPLYNWDKTNFLPRVGFAWSPKGGNFISKLLRAGSNNSVIRGGFAMVPDYFGESVATFFDQHNTLGFSASTSIPVNTFNVGCGHYVMVGNGLATCTSNPGPLFTSFTQPVRSLPLVPAPSPLVFPLQLPEVSFPTQIQEGLDSGLTTPKNYVVSLTYEREVGKNGKFQVSYVGRFARNLLAQRDAATPIDLKDPASGQTMYQAGTILEKARQAGVPLAQVGVSGGTVAPQPFFEHFFPLANVQSICPTPTCTTATQAWYSDALGNTNDWTTTELDFENLSTLGAHAFYQGQYGALVAWSTVAYSNYHSLQASYQERLHDLILDFNYTYSHSMDDASGLQAAGSYSNSALILNPFQPQDNYTSSDFDLRHVITVDSVWQLPVGKGKRFASDAGGFLDALIGGWQLSNIFRWNSGLPLGVPYDAAQWATNWEVQSYTTADPKAVPVNGCSSRSGTATPKFFGNCLNSAFVGFRSSYPGDTGSRNYLRLPHYIDLDAGLGKTWTMPYNDNHTLQFRWEVFNVSNTQEFAGLDFSRTGWGIPGAINTLPAVNFSNWTSVVPNSNRVMQFGLRYAF